MTRSKDIKTCTECGTINPPESQTCDCGASLPVKEPSRYATSSMNPAAAETTQTEPATKTGVDPKTDIPWKVRVNWGRVACWIWRLLLEFPLAILVFQKVGGFFGVVAAVGVLIVGEVIEPLFTGVITGPILRLTHTNEEFNLYVALRRAEDIESLRRGWRKDLRAPRTTDVEKQKRELKEIITVVLAGQRTIANALDGETLGWNIKTHQKEDGTYTDDGSGYYYSRENMTYTVLADAMMNAAGHAASLLLFGEDSPDVRFEVIEDSESGSGMPYEVVLKMTTSLLQQPENFERLKAAVAEMTETPRFAKYGFDSDGVPNDRPSETEKTQKQNDALEEGGDIAEEDSPVARAMEDVTRAMFLRQVGEFDEAISILQKSLKRHPEFTHTILGLGRTLMAAGKLAEALEFLKKYVDMPNEENKIAVVQIWAIMGEINLKLADQESSLELRSKRINEAANCFFLSLESPVSKGYPEKALEKIHKPVQKQLLYAIAHAWGATKYLRNEDNKDEFDSLAGIQRAVKSLFILDHLLRPENLAGMLDSDTKPTKLIRVLKYLYSLYDDAEETPYNVWVEGFIAAGAACLGDTPWAEKNGPVEKVLGIEEGWMEYNVEYNKREHQGNDDIEISYRLYAEGFVRLINANFHRGGLGTTVAFTGFGDDGEIITAIPDPVQAAET